jgi:Tol biopolymer transport system component
MPPRFSVVIAANLLASCGGSPRPQPAPYASDGPVTAPQIFGRDVISTAAPEFAIAFSPDGTTAYFDRATPDRSKFSIVASRFERGAWQPATPLAFSTGEYRDADPFVTADGARLYFSSNRPIGERTDWNTWFVEKRGDAWSEPMVAPGPLSAAENEVFVSFARDGTAYYATNKTGDGDIYRARDGASEPLSISTATGESNPAISPDGTLLVFAAERPGGLGGADLYASRHTGAAWSEPLLLRAASSPYADFAPYISPDGRYLFFTSERPGVAPAQAEGRPPGDIYQIDLQSAVR